MKKVAAILFLSVLLFNLYGYQWVIDYIQDRKEKVLITQLDQEAYQDEDLISIKTPISLPYYTNSPTYERVDGTIEIEGIEYKYVKRRVYNDSLELLCIPNIARQQLRAAKADFIKLSHGYPAAEGSKKATATIKIVLPEYCEDLTAFIFNPAGQAPKTYAGFRPCFLPVAGTTWQGQPPEGSMSIFS